MKTHLELLELAPKLGKHSTHDMSTSVLGPIEPFLKGHTGRNTRGLLRLIILCTVAAAAVASRLFSVIRKLSPYIGLYAVELTSP